MAYFLRPLPTDNSYPLYLEMKLGRESEYAIEGLIALARKPFGAAVLLREVAASRKIPESFLAKIFQKLTKAGVLQSSRGRIRGYALSRRPGKIKIEEVFLAVEGADVFDRCIFWSNRCAESHPCAMHFRWKRIRQHTARMMKQTTLADLVRARP